MTTLTWPLTPIGTGGQTDDGSDGAAFSATIARVSTISDSVGSNVASAMLGANASSYLRVPFNLASLPSLDNLKFRVRYDDGFVAYLNGTEVARRNAPVAQTGAVLANSVTEHSGVQGQNNWFYGFYPKSLDPDGVYHPNSDFISMDPNWTFSGSTWLMGPGDPPWTFMNSGGGHPNGPNSGVTQWPIKRWVAEAAGTMTANIRLAKPVNCGEGTTLRLFHNGTEVWKQPSGFNEPIGFWPRVQLTDVKVGDFIDLALDSTGVGEATGDGCDATTYNMTIIQSPGNGLDWNSPATRSRDTAAVGNTEEIDLTTQLSLITTGDNVLAIHGLNAARNDSDFLIAPTLSGTSTAIAGSGGVYFLGASPSTTNGLGSTTIGPIVKDATNSVIAGDADNIVVTARITRSLDPIGPARLRYRVMYGPEIELPFLDDGLSGEGAAGDGVYGAAIPASASAPGEMVRWRIVSEDSNGDVTRSPTFHDAADSPEYWGTVITTPNVVPGSQIGVFHWFTADTGGSDSGGARGSIYYNGQFLDNVYVDVHGQSSVGFPKKSYDFKLNTSHKLAWDPTPMNNTPRVNSFNLLTTYPDKAAIRNLLSYDVFDTAGVAGHAVIPIQVRRNNNFFSLAHFMEDGDEDFLQREPGLDDLGSLYKMYSTFDSIAGAEKKSRRWETNGDLVTFQAGLLQSSLPRERFIYDNAGIPETINYLSALIMTGNDDVGHKNYYLYRDTVGNGEWRVLPWDQDLSFGRVWRPEYNYFGDVMVSDTSLFLGGGNLFMKRFVDNSIPALRQMHLRRLRTLADTLLNQNTVPLAQRFFENRIDVLKTFVKPEADYERLNNVWPSWGTAQTVDQAIDLIKDDYLPNRRNYVFTHPDLPPSQDPMVVVNFGTVEFDPDSHNQAQEYFTIVNPSATVAVDVSGWVIGGGVNHVLKPGTVIPANGTLYLSPDVVAFRARTVGPRGNQSLFVQGNYNGQLSARGETLTLIDGVRLVSTLTYTGDPTAAQTNLRITEIMYNPGLLTGSTFATGEYEYIELRNTSTTLTLDLTGVRFTAGCDFAFTSGTMLAPGAFAVIAKNTTAFAQRYPTITPAGVFLGALNNGGDRITLLDADNEEIHDFDYQDTWHPLTDGAGFSLQTVDQAALFSDWNLATQWRPSGKLNGTPGALDSVGDFDNDGMSDLWEAQNGLNPTNPADANLDLDFDGQTNLEEFIAGTVPGSSVSRFAITSNTQADGTFNGSFPGIAGKTYTVQYSESLSSGTWQNLSNHAPVANGSVPFTDTPPANHPRRFYRIITPQLP